MLVLSRKMNEVIRIGHDIEVMVVRIEPYQVRLGVKAPSGVPIHRQEVYAAIHSGNENDEQLPHEP